MTRFILLFIVCCQLLQNESGKISRLRSGDDSTEKPAKKPKLTLQKTAKEAKPVMNVENMRIFWRYIIERHNIYKKRINNQTTPWTNDKILLKWKFTNVFRDIDPG
eukprot:536191_1